MIRRETIYHARSDPDFADFRQVRDECHQPGGGSMDPANDCWWEDFRRRMPVAARWAYFDHAGVSPLSGPAADVLHEWTADTAENGVAGWTRWRGEVEQCRRLGAELLGAHADELALIRNTTEGIGLVAEGFPWQPGDNVVVPDCEFPSNLYPWRNLESRGVEVRLLPALDERLDLDRLDEACDSRTRVVAVSWVGYATGWRNDVAALADIAHRRGALLFLDAIQGLGVFPLDVSRTPVDFLAADGHKWLLGPEGAGLFYLRREHLDRLRPLGVGWNSVRHSGDFTNTAYDLKSSADRYEGGTHNMAGFAALAASLRLLLEIGVERLSERLLDVTDRLCDRLRQVGAQVASCRDGERWSGIVAFTLAGRDPVETKKRCRHAGVVLNARAGRLRASPHVYTSAEDIERLLEAMQA
ncbi:MAG TPA: aminotransferase class V-fold PLP-dependent enzyme [Planctomycetaceae bacterium]|nr:aminotransferase class V-fold PLP-dependent enzyme [Planctomycetaceae bacterium]